MPASWRVAVSSRIPDSWLVAAGLARLGTLMKYMPQPLVTGFTAGNRYLVTAADGNREDIWLARIDSGTPKLLYSTSPLSRDYAVTTTTVRAFELEASFPDTEADDEQEIRDGGGPYQVTWSYTIDGRQYVVPQTVFASVSRTSEMCCHRPSSKCCNVSAVSSSNSSSWYFKHTCAWLKIAVEVSSRHGPGSNPSSGAAPARTPSNRIPNALASRAVARPMLPVPTISIVWPRSSRQ